MTRDELLARISVDPAVCLGRPCIRGHRIHVSRIVDVMANGWTIEEVLETYPGLEQADVLACLAYRGEK